MILKRGPVIKPDLWRLPRYFNDNTGSDSVTTTEEYLKQSGFQIRKTRWWRYDVIPPKGWKVVFIQGQLQYRVVDQFNILRFKAFEDHIDIDFSDPTNVLGKNFKNLV
jgi:hypothetical protein